MHLDLRIGLAIPNHSFFYATILSGLGKSDDQFYQLGFLAT